MEVALVRYGDPRIRTVRLNRRMIVTKLYNPPPNGRWLLAIDPDTLIGRVVVQRSDGFVPDVQGHEDLFPLLICLEREDGLLEGGD